MLNRIAQTTLRDATTLLLATTPLLFGPACPSLQAQEPAQETTIELAIDAWLHIRPWIDDLYVPTAERITSDEALGPEVEGVSVILRFGGRILGVGDARDRGPDTLRQATAAAVRDALDSKRVQDLPLDMIESIGRSTTIELELQHPPVPLLGGTFEDITGIIRPGIDGLAVRRADAWSIAFPGRMQAFGLAERPDRVLIRLLRELGLPPKTPEELRRIDDVEFYRFEVTVLTQQTAEGMPFESVRGAAVIAPSMELETQASEIAKGAADNLVARLASDPLKEVGEIPGGKRLDALGIFGDYDTMADAYDPLVAPPADQALVAWALGRYTNEVPGLSDEEQAEFRRIGRLIVNRLAVVDDVEDDPLSDDRCIALIVLADLALRNGQGAPPTNTPLVEKARNRLLEEVAGSKDIPDGEQSQAGTLALTALAVCRLASVHPDVVSTEEAHALLEAAWRTPNVNTLVGALHFLILADRHLDPNPSASSQQDAAHHLIEASIANQIGHSDSLAAPIPPVTDLGGGFVLSGSPRPTAGASSLRLALALAAAARTDWFPAADRREAWEEALRLALRFARQLQFDENQLHRAPSPVRALGGIRKTPWSTKTRTSDTALALLLATEILGMESKQAAPEPAESGPRTGPNSP